MSTTRRNLGGLYRRTNSPFWWMRYSVSGRQVRESTRCVSIDEAREALQQRLAEVMIYRLRPRDAERVTVAELVPLIVGDYELNRLRSMHSLKASLNQRIVPMLGTVRVSDLSPATLADFCRRMRTDTYAEGTIAVTLAHLHRMLTLAVRQRLIPPTMVPHFPRPQLDNARQGVIHLDELRRLCVYLSPEIADLAEFAFWSGWRKGEILRVEWRDYRSDTRELHLRLANDKAKRGRVLAVGGPLADVMQRRLKARCESPLIFHRNGKLICGFRSSWNTACKSAGLSGRLFHDLRRTAVTNLVRAGVPLPTVMAQSGHRTMAVFLRYNILDGNALADAQTRLAEYVHSTDEKGHER